MLLGIVLHPTEIDAWQEIQFTTSFDSAARNEAANLSKGPYFQDMWFTYWA